MKPFDKPSSSHSSRSSSSQHQQMDNENTQPLERSSSLQAHSRPTIKSQNTQGCDDNGECVDNYIRQTTTPLDEKDILGSTNIFEECVTIISTLKSQQPRKVYQYSARDFHKLLRKYPHCKDLTNYDGYNLLHLVILERRVDLLEPLFHCGILFDMVDIRVCKPGTSDHGLTAQGIINKYYIKNLDRQLENFRELEESMTKLHKIARTGNAKAVQFLLDKHPQMMETSASDGSNCLMWAVTSGNPEVVMMIVEAARKAAREAAGDYYQTKTSCGETPLGRATYLGYTDIIAYLIKELSFNPNETCKGESTPVSIAIENADLDVLTVLAECNASFTNSMLPLAAISGLIELWRYVYHRIKNVDINRKDKNGRSSFTIAVENGYMDMEKYIIQKTGSLMEKDLFGNDVLFTAIDSRSIEEFKFILEKLKSSSLLEQSINERNSYRRRKTVFKIIGRDVYGGNLCYHLVKVKRIYLDIFHKRRYEGGELDVANFGKIIYSGLGAPSMQSMEDINKQYHNSQGSRQSGEPDMTPLHYAILHRQTEMALILIKEGADVNAKDYFENQPIHIAAMRGDMEVIKALEDYGINYESHGELNETPQVIAEINRHYDLATYIESKLNGNDDIGQLHDFEDE